MHSYDGLVSVVSPCYNSERHLEKLINCVIRQSVRVLEHIVIDDGSSDNTLAILSTLAEKYSHIKVLSQDNAGAGSARNRGIEIASGKYIAFLDADDDWLEGKLESQISFMETNNVVFSFGDYRKIDDLDGSVIGQASCPEKLGYRDLLKGCPIGCLTVAYNQEYLGKLYMPDVRRGQDYGFWLLITRRGVEAYRYPGVFANYRICRNSLSKNKVKKSLDIFYIYFKEEKLGLLRSIFYFSCFSLSVLRK